MSDPALIKFPSRDIRTADHIIQRLAGQGWHLVRFEQSHPGPARSFDVDSYIERLGITIHDKNLTLSRQFRISRVMLTACRDPQEIKERTRESTWRDLTLQLGHELGVLS